MTPPLYDLNSPPSPFPLVDLNEQKQLFLSLHQHTASPSSANLKVNYFVTGDGGSRDHLSKFQFLSNSNNAIRVCSDCNTSTTPLWRSGPGGPKSLCNACGIRQRKARRALEAAASGAAVAADASSLKIMIHGNKEMKKSRPVYKKQLKSHNQIKRRKELCFKEFDLSLSKNSGLRHVFPRDVEDAAILLMELSCGLFHS